MGITPSGYDVTLTREEYLRFRNGTVKKDTELEPESQDCNEQESDSDSNGD
jgi:hypothetical protein